MFEFWVYVTGFSSNQFDVTLFTGNQIERATLERSHYQHVFNWTLVRVPVGRVDVPFQIAIDSSRSPLYGWVAIDDTRLYNCGLPPVVTSTLCQGPNQFYCARGSCITRNRLCDMTDDCGDHSDEYGRECSSYKTCTFEQDLCYWRHDNTTEFLWEVIQGPSPSYETGVS